MKLLTAIGLMLLLSMVVLTDVGASREITEIIVLGNTRTPDAVILRQLPFALGDTWNDTYEQWVFHRLTALEVFSYESPQIVMEPLNDETCRVVVRVGDPIVLYREPMEFAITTGIDLTSQQFRPVLYNPWGTGQNLQFDLNWGTETYRGRITSPLGPGASGLTAGRTTHSDDTKEWLIQADYTYWSSDSWRQQARLGAFFLDEDATTITSGFSLGHKGPLNTNVSFDLGTPQTSDPTYWRVQGVAHAEAKPFVLLVRAGYSSSTTPSRRLFQVGGFSQLPLRAESSFTPAQSYAIGTLEYHYPVNPMLSWVVLVDGGFLWENDTETGILNVGAGLSLATPVGLPVRLDMVVNPASGDFRFNVGLRATYAPPL